MKKFLFMLLAILILPFCFIGCTTEERLGLPPQFIVVEEYDKYSYVKVADKETGVVYLFWTRTHKGGMTPLYKADGTLYIYNFETGEIE